MFSDYQPLAGRHDELIDSGGRVRAHWRDLARGMDALDPRRLTERRLELQRLLSEHGVTYNIYGRDARRPSPWALDLLPMMLTSREWREVEVGIAQRAELFRAILADLYGPQNLLRRGGLPARLVLSHPGFLLPCWGAEAIAERMLPIYAADLGRAPDGRFWVIADRTQAPSGMGYALEARTILSRVLPSLFRDANVHPVLPFLRALRRTLLRLADDDPATIGVLTPGLANETYSEHAYLARQMGLPLVEGSDLLVENGRCLMLTPGGLQPIRVLLRRVDEAYCDPLELGRQSVLGAPGLLQCVRNRTLTIANPLGSGVLENPGLAPYLPQLCQTILGESLKLPNVPAWWCGDPAQWSEVDSRFGEMVVRDIYDLSVPPRAIPLLDADARDTLHAAIRARPERYTAQIFGAHSTAPVLTRKGVSARSVEVRTFAVADGDSYRVMPGGLARTGRTRDSWRVSGQLGGLSKDVWILASESQRSAQILPHFLQPRSRALALREPHIADNILWLARYTARAELLARLLGMTIKRLIESPAAATDPLAHTLLEAVSWQTTLYPGFIGEAGAAARAEPLPELLRVIQSDEFGALRASCLALQQAAHPLRHLLTTEIMTQLVRLDQDLTAITDLSSALRAMEWVQLRLAAVTSHLQRSLAEGGVRHLVDMGLAVESALGTVRLVRSLIVNPKHVSETGPLLMDLIDTTAAMIDNADLGSQATLLDVALLAEDNPRSVRYQIMRVDSALRAVPGVRGAHTGLESDVADKLVALGAWDISALLSSTVQPELLDRTLHELDDWLRSCAERLTARYVPARIGRISQLVQTA